MTGPRWLWPVGLVAVMLLAAVLRFAWLDALPPGLHYDEAAYAMQALDLRANPRPEVFFPAFTGHEPLFIYLLALATKLLGESVWAIRATSAAIGVFAVLATALAGRRLFGPGVGLLAAALLAGSFWHLMFTRQVHRLNLLVALAPLAVWLLWRARERPTPLRVLLAGGGVGLLAYTYVTARLLLVGLGLFLLIELLSARREQKLLALGVGLLAVLVAAPLGIYFLQHPDQFTVRFAQTAGGNLSQSAIATLGMFGWRGDIQPKFNLPGRPALDVVLSALLALGALASLAAIAAPRSRLLLLWWLGALAAGFLTIDTPNFGRLNAAAPPTYLLVAVGTGVLWRLAAPRLALRSVAGTLAGILLVVAESSLTARAYFVQWAPTAEAYYALHGDVADLGRLARNQPAGVRLYVASEHYQHPTLHYLAGGDTFARLRWFDGRHALLLPGPGQESRHLLPRSARPPEADLTGPVVSSVADPSGQAAVEVRGSTDALPALAFGDPVRATFAPAGEADRPWAELAGVSAPAIAAAGDQVVVRTVWRILVDRPPRTPDIFAHAIDAHGRRWGQRDVSPLLAPEWRLGETLVVWLVIPLHELAPAGDYRLRIGLNDPTLGRALDARSPDGRVSATGVEPLVLRVSHRGVAVETAALPRIQGAQLPGSRLIPALPTSLPMVRLLASAAPRTVAVGEVAIVDLLWLATEESPHGSASLMLRRDDQTRVIESRQLEELDPLLPWRAAERQLDSRRFAPSRADVGEWQIVVVVGSGHVLLGQLEVTAPAASFDAPLPRTPIDVEFDGAARLLGIDTYDDRVTLYWRAVGPTGPSHSVFVHALAADGHILAQHDGVPAGGTRPTRGWLPDEVITDEHPLRRPAGTVALAVGLYDPSTGLRVPLTTGTDHIRVQADRLAS